MDPQAAVELETGSDKRSFLGQVFALGVHVFIFGLLAYLAFLKQGGIAAQLFVAYASSIPLAIVLRTVVEIGRARQRLTAHHAIAAWVSGVLGCGLAGLLFVFGTQIVLGFLGSLVVVWVTRYSPAAQYLKPPSFGDLGASAHINNHRSLWTLATIAGTVALLVAGVGLAWFAFIGELHRPGGISITIGG